jgi:hypothetical protein
LALCVSRARHCGKETRKRLFACFAFVSPVVKRALADAADDARGLDRAPLRQQLANPNLQRRSQQYFASNFLHRELRSPYNNDANVAGLICKSRVMILKPWGGRENDLTN